MIATAVRNVGFVPQPTDDHLTGLKRESLLVAGVYYNVPDVVAQALTLFQANVGTRACYVRGTPGGGGC